MGRPPGYQWQPLGLDADPVPGDPAAVSTEAAHLASVARAVTGQIAALHPATAGRPANSPDSWRNCSTRSC
jgi:hypothetical protein